MNDEQLNKVFTAVTNLETKVDEGYARLEETKADKSDIVRIDSHLERVDSQLDGIDSKVDRLIESHVKMDARISNIEITLADMSYKADMDRIFKTLDYIVDKLDTDATERAAQSSPLSRHDEVIDEHDNRRVKGQNVCF